MNQTITFQEEFRDKYWGREILSEKIANALAYFFFDGFHFFYKQFSNLTLIGEKIRYKVIETYLKELNALYNVIKECKGYRFNSVSLLFVYDPLIEDKDIENIKKINYSDNSVDGEIDLIIPKKIILKLIDFANSEIIDDNEPDFELLRGIENLENTLKIIKDTPNIDLYY